MTGLTPGLPGHYWIEVPGNRASTIMEPASWWIEPSVLARHNVEGISSEVNIQGSRSGLFGPWYFGGTICKPAVIVRPRYDITGSEVEHA